jgi:hypothetical protein
MAKLTSSADFGIRFVEQEEFDRLVRTRTLTPGFWYFVGNSFHIAFTLDTYNTYGGISIKELVEELLQHDEFNQHNLYQQIVEQILVSPTFIQQVAQHFINNETIVQQIANYILNDESVIQNITNQMQEIVNQIVTSVVSINAPDGSVLATNNDGVLTLPVATNSQFGIVRGQPNDTLTTWHNASIENGTLSINRTQIETVMDSKGITIRDSINVRAEDDCIIGTNNNGVITLPMRLLETEPTNNTGLSFIKEHAHTP